MRTKNELKRLDILVEGLDEPGDKDVVRHLLHELKQETEEKVIKDGKTIIVRKFRERIVSTRVCIGCACTWCVCAWCVCAFCFVVQLLAHNCWHACSLYLVRN